MGGQFIYKTQELSKEGGKLFDAHDDFTKFYKKHVKLGNDTYDVLRDYRDKNYARVEKGLGKMGYNSPIKDRGQGSYSMGTMVQQPNNDYDIDHAIIFRKDDLPDSPFDARTRIKDALCESGDVHLFSQEPQRRTNAVTVWYQTGYHVDLAVYRCYEDIFGNEIIEHAGTEWRKRDPVGMNTWFAKQVKDRSPKQDYGAKVDESQMLRIVQFLKMFTKARSENMPGGLIISVLVSECYVADYDRDDVALVETMKRIRTRTQYNHEVWNPVDTLYKLTNKPEHYSRVGNFHDALEKALDNRLTPLFDADCDAVTAYKAWNKVFKHEFWKNMIKGVESQASKLYTDYATGGIHLIQPSESYVEIPPHQFFGDD
jgi:hypothetical protein